MGLLEEIRDLAADNTVPLETVLLKCMVLADILGDETLMHWLAQELDGYKKRSDVPDYRIVHGQADAQVTNGMRYETIDVSNIAFPSDAPPDAYERLNTVRFTDGIKELETIQSRTDLVRNLDTDLRYYIDQNSRKASGYWVREAYIPIPPGAIAGVLGSIRSRVLQYIFRLRRDFPEFDQQSTREQAPSSEELKQVFQVTIGHGSAVTFGSGSAYAQNIDKQLVVGDLSSLKSYLHGKGVERADLDVLDEVIAEAKPADLDNDQSPVRRWIENVAEKAGAGGKELAKTATRELVLLSVRYFFGNVTG